MNNEGRLTAIVVTYCRPEELAVTLDSMNSQTRPPDVVILVDNDPGGSARATATERGVQYLPAPENVGPAGGIALGMEWVCRTADDCDLVVLIDDDDPIPDTQMLERLVELLSDAGRRGERCAGVGGAGSRYRPHRGDFRRVLDAELHGAVPVDYIGGGQFPVYRVSAIRDVGTFDSTFFFGFDDADFGLRLRAGGWTLLVPGDLWLERRAATGRLGVARSPRAQSAPPTWRQYYSSRNAVHLARRYGSTRAVFEVSLRGIVVTPLRRLTHRSAGAAKAAVMGTAAGLRGELGRTVEPSSNKPDPPRS